MATRRIGHTVDLKSLSGDREYFEETLGGYAKEMEVQKKDGNAEFFLGCVDLTLGLARLQYLFGDDAKKVSAGLRKGLTDLVTIVEIGAPLSPIEMRKYLGAALVSNTVQLIKWLGRLSKDFFSHPDIEISEAGYLLVAALQTGALSDSKKFQTAVNQFVKSLSPGKLKIDPRSEKSIYGPLCELLKSILAKDQEAFDEAWRGQAAAWKKRYGRPSEDANNEGILDFEALGIGRIALNFGLTVRDDNPYAPLELLQSDKPA